MGDRVFVENITNLAAARGNLPYIRTVHKFGENQTVAASSTEAVASDGIIWQPSAASTLRIKASGNAADDSDGGDNARSITIEGLDANFNEVTVDVDTQGADASSATSQSFIRVNRVFVKEVGVYGNTNAGNIVIEVGGGGTDVIEILAGNGQTQSSLYCVPAGYTAYLSHVSFGVGSTKAADVPMYQRQGADNTDNPKAKRLVHKAQSITGATAQRPFRSYPSFPAKTDLWCEATTLSGAVAVVAANYDLYLVED